ncbi:MAG TPA: NAD(P)-dependent oxidoreductase, partial [Candidatus Portnoybacteria bacterium]|nr:NAD(P)-dependent oxidoreductase [Candidatus Portnoybacteria bacterium]
MENKTLILGVQGQLGSELSKIFPQAIAWDKDNLDITDRRQVETKISQLKPDLVINAAAYTKVDDCEKNRELALKVNGQAVGYLAETCRKKQIILVHFSTDYVFSGDKPEGYKEDDRPGPPINVYGESKLLGERLLQKNCQKYYLIRTAWLFGQTGPNFVQAILKKASQGQSLEVVND